MGLFSKYKLRIDIPEGMILHIEDEKARFIGSPDSLIKLANELRKLSQFENGDLIKLDDVDLKVSEVITTNIRNKNIIEMPQKAWGIFASKILEVVHGYEDSPFFFNDCGYLYPPLNFDIGVELIEY